ncbi:hypothetical protein ELQ12_09505, partial [Campylobacter sp. US25a]|uniref:hypothetical protein n=1 Tax=Campylobacter sp. US25a TaxID=2498119 RepID=UPI001104581D
MTNENIYSSLQVVLDSNVSQLKTQSQEKDFGVAGQIFSNSVGAAGAYSQEKIKVLFDTSDKLGKQVGSRLIKVNFGIFNILYKKLEQKSNEKIAKELLIEGATGYVVTKSVATSFAIKQVAKETGKKITIRTGVGIIGRVFTGIGIGAIAGSEIPIVGTVVGAVVGTLVAGFINDRIFGDEDEELKKQEAKEKYLEEKLDEKMHKIINYLITHQYIELRVLNEDEAEKLCKEISDINSAYFKTILLMLSFPYYLDKDEQSYKKAQEKNPTIIRIQPIANTLNIKIEINECFLAKNGEALKNKEIYVYNHRFNRVVAKAMSDDEGKIVFENVYVGKES